MHFVFFLHKSIIIRNLYLKYLTVLYILHSILYSMFKLVVLFTYTRIAMKTNLNLYNHWRWTRCSIRIYSVRISFQKYKCIFTWIFFVVSIFIFQVSKRWIIFNENFFFSFNKLSGFAKCNVFEEFCKGKYLNSLYVNSVKIDRFLFYHIDRSDGEICFERFM